MPSKKITTARAHPLLSTRKRRSAEKDIKRRKYTIRIAFFLIFLSFLFSVFLGKAYQLQVVQHKFLRSEKMKQGNTVVSFSGKRGDIFDRKGRTIATSVRVFSVFADPTKIENKKETAKVLSDILRIPENVITKKLDMDRYFVWIKRQISDSEYKKVKSLNLKGIYFLREWKRVYPHRNLFSHLVGYVNIDSVGLEGIERTYEKYLRAKDVKVVARRDRKGRTIFMFPPKEPEPGKNIQLSIDLDLQHIIDRELEQLIKDKKPKGVFAVAMDINTGEILSFSSKPDFDPNYYKSYAGMPNVVRSKIHQMVFEPGSAFKIFIMASALENKFVTPDDTFWCEEGEWNFSGKVIRDVKSIGWTDINGIIKYSSNICIAKISLTLGEKIVYSSVKDFGFGSKTGIDLPGEETGIVRHWKKWHPLDLATIGFGQGIAVTPIQLIVAFSAVVNGGYLIKPSVMKSIIDKNGETVYNNEPKFIKRVITEKTSDILREMMILSVESGTATKAGIEEYGAGGKTGTAQKVQGGKYVEGKYISCFVGFSPKDNPIIALLICVDEPVGEYYGGQVAAPVFSKVVREYLALTGVETKVAQTSTTKPYDAQKEEDKDKDKEKRITLRDLMNTLTDEELSKLEVKGYGYVKKVERSLQKINVFLSPE